MGTLILILFSPFWAATGCYPKRLLAENLASASGSTRWRFCSAHFGIVCSSILVMTKSIFG